MTTKNNSTEHTQTLNPLRDFCSKCNTYVELGHCCENPIICDRWNYVNHASISVCPHCGKTLWMQNKTLRWSCGKWDYTEGGCYSTNCFTKLAQHVTLESMTKRVLELDSLTYIKNKGRKLCIGAASHDPNSQA